jgi:hypothetical protein
MIKPESENREGEHPPAKGPTELDSCVLILSARGAAVRTEECYTEDSAQHSGRRAGCVFGNITISSDFCRCRGGCNSRTDGHANVDRLWWILFLCIGGC